MKDIYQGEQMAEVKIIGNSLGFVSQPTNENNPITFLTALVGKQLIFRLFNADNEAFAYLDGNLWAAYATEGDPSFQQDYSISLAQGTHTLTIGGINWGGPAHFRYDVILDNVVRDHVDWRAGATANGLCYSKTYQIMTAE